MTEFSLPHSKLVVATHNPGKARELAEILVPLGLEIVTAGELGLGEPEETETSFIGNALIKSRAACLASGLPALADDSGLEVMALNREPGIYSARWAGPKKDFNLAMQRVEDEIQTTNSKDRSARFVCALSVTTPESGEIAVEGEVKGQIVFPARGEQGFGYDPIFQPNGFDMTFGEMDPDKKHAMSHRADAFAQLLARLKIADA